VYNQHSQDSDKISGYNLTIQLSYGALRLHALPLLHTYR